jgi:arabinofuranan 3-O-arabinosyltransferase
MTSTSTPPDVSEMASEDFQQRPTPISWIAIATLPLAVGVMLQRFGQIVYLTRLDRVLNPFTMASRAFDLWNPFWDMGAIQFQQNGYWLPFDLWFGIGKTLQIPPWISERLYIYVFLAVALWGFVRLADAFAIGKPWTRLVAGFAFAISPVILSRIAWQSPFAMGAIFLPWALLPLVRATRHGSARKAAALSAIAIALIGGANAAITLAILPVPVLYLLTRSRGPRRARLFRWWFFCVALATLSWTVGLVLFAKYGPNVLQYTESVSVTTGFGSIFETLRGTSDWVARLPSSTNPAGFALTNRSLPIIATSVVAAAGIAGLARRRLPERTFLIFCLLAGVAIVGGGFGGLFGNPATPHYRDLLDGTLAAFRNVYKFQALIALPLSMGVAYLLAGLFELPVVKARTIVRQLLVVLIIGTLATASWPLWRNSLTRGPGVDSIPAAWLEANQWLEENSEARVIVLPGIPDSEFDWGFTQMLPIELEPGVTWAYRSQAPLSGIDVLSYLDGVEIAIERGGDPALPMFLGRGGFSYVVVPNDQRSEKYGAPPPETVRNAMIASGFERVAGFGERKYGFGSLQQVEIYAVPGGSVAATYPESSATWLSGDVSSSLSIPTTIFGDRPYILTRDTTTSPLQPQQWIVTDGNQASTTIFGLNRNNKSYILSESEAVTPFGQRDQEQTVQRLDGFGAVTASSVGPGIIVDDLPAFSPSHVLDGDLDTWWVPNRYQLHGPEVWGPVDPSVTIDFAKPTMVDHLETSLFIGVYATPSPIDVTVTTDGGSATTRLLPLQSLQPLSVIQGMTNSVTVSIARSSYSAIGDVIGIRELTLPGTPVTLRLVVPSQLTWKFSDPGTPDPAWVFTRNRPATSPLVSLNQEPQISRAFTVPKSGTFRLIATALATRGQKLLDWFGTTPDFTISADSTWGESPKVGPRNLVDGDATSPWRSGNDVNIAGGNSLISMRWSGQRTISSLRLHPGEGDAQPTDVVIYSGAETRDATVAPDGSVIFDPVNTDSLSMRINYAPIPLGDVTSSPRMGFSSIDIPAIADLYPGPIDRAAPYLSSCGDGLSIKIGASITRYFVSATAGALIEGSLITLSPCESDSVTLAAGETLLDTSSGDALVTIQQAVVGNAPTMAPPTGVARSLRVEHWGTNDRTVSVGDGSGGLLAVNEAFNEGWTASLNGSSLTALKLDGWRQAFLLPDGMGGVVSLEFAPNRIFRFGTIFGLFTLFGVLIMALWPDRKKRHFDELREGRPAKALLIIGVIIGAVWCTGIGAVLLVPAWWIRNGRSNWLAPIAFLSMSISGVLVVIGTRIVDYPSHLWGSASYPVSALAAASFLCALVTLLPRRNAPDHVAVES